jgi:hypothetical protein
MDHTTTTTPSGEGLDRRQLLKQGIIWGGVGAASATLTGAVTTLTRMQPAGAETVSALAYDVACLGDTFRWIPAPGAHLPDDLRGSTFSVEGVIYPPRTIQGTGFNPTAAAGIGSWLCRGWIMIAPGRPEPHVLSTQEFIFGEITPQRLYPPDQLVTSGLEGSADESQVPVRSVVGGTGKYAGARGVALQHGLGRNTTTITTLGGIPAPNFRFEFQLA